ncbi:Aste57867_4194 [Aphanomyces stellatus]|uniref:Aste57867_4194 protein n=1 Tax=Aphanomyces stellatus TaxID=120398 RepID=A0A485KCD5_9STRA|nr:hypothetical protein As57867_004183 [Aphanomyces stellatus]VFT81314.1 Aste57867_4194 [Aphanomyces stellatus]
MAWCRWADAKTCCEYLVTQSISNEIDPRNLLRTRSGHGQREWDSGGVAAVPSTMGELVQTLAKSVEAFTSGKQPVPKATKQLSMNNFVAQKSIPTARSAREAWQQWFVADPSAGLVCALKDYNSDMIRRDRKKYSERVTLASAFSKYQSYDEFESAYTGCTESYAGVLREVRRRKRVGML